MSKTCCGVPYRELTLFMLYVNLAWMLSLIGVVVNAILNFDDAKTKTHMTSIEHGLTFITIMILLGWLFTIYFEAVVFIQRKKSHNISKTIQILILEACFLLLCYIEINLEIIHTWDRIVDQTIQNLPECLEEVIRQGSRATCAALLSFPLIIKIFTAMILRMYNDELKRTLQNATVTTINSSSPPPYELCSKKEYIDENSLPAYSECTIDEIVPLNKTSN